MKLDIELLNRIKNEVAKEYRDSHDYPYQFWDDFEQECLRDGSEIHYKDAWKEVCLRYSEEVNKKPDTKTADDTNPDLRFKFVSIEEWERWSKMQAPENLGTHRGAWLEGEWAGYSQCMANEVARRGKEIDALKKMIEELESELTIIHDQFNGSGFFGNIVIRIKKLLNPSTNGK